MIKSLIFDCDGVILESVEVKTQAFGRLFAKHGEQASRRMVEYHVENGGMSRYEKFAWFYREVIQAELSKARIAELDAAFSELCLSGVLSSAYVPGALEFIEANHQKHLLFAASGTPENELREIFAKRGLAGYFKGVFGSPEKKAAIVRKILAEYGLKPCEALFVGDSRADFDAARETGTHFLGRGQVEPGQPWLEDLRGLEDHLRTLNGQAL